MLSHTLRLTSCLHVAVLTPKVFLLSVWPLPRSLATTYRISFDFSSSPYLDVSVQGLISHQPGCPIRKSADIMPAYGSPQLIAVNHVLLRLPVPRHSPCALCSLTFFLSRISLCLPYVCTPWSKTAVCLCLTALLCDPLFEITSFHSLIIVITNYPF